MTPAPIRADEKRTKLMKAMRAEYNARDDLTAVLTECWPVGGLVQWRRGRFDKTYTGQVLLISRGSVKVRNVDTKREFWISAFDVLCVSPELKDALFSRSDAPYPPLPYLARR